MLSNDKTRAMEGHLAYMNTFMQVTLEYIDKEAVKNSPKKMRTLCAYFYGPADHYGLKMGLDPIDILKNLWPTLIRHMALTKPEAETAIRLLAEWDQDESTKIMDKGCVALAKLVNISDHKDEVNWDDAENQRMLMAVCLELSQLLEES